MAGAIAFTAAGHFPGGALAADGGCRAPPEILRFEQTTPQLKAAFASDNPLRIVAFGSSSTQGTGASGRAATYPAQLEAALRARFPGREITVINRGKAGDLTSDMLARLENDVLREAPTLIIWQTGVNDAIRGIGRGELKALVTKGIAEMRRRGSEVVLVDHQYFPRSANVRDYQGYLADLRDLGRALGVPVFRRYELMSHLVESRQYRAEDLLARDGFHQNDLSYRCLGRTLAVALQGLAGAPPAVTPESKVATGRMDTLAAQR